MNSTAAARHQRAKWEIDRAIHAAIYKVSSNPAQRFELCRLVAHVRAHSSILSAVSSGRLHHQDCARRLGGLVALTEHHRDWLREVEAWRGPKVSARDQFAALARFLLANKFVPAFMTSVWLAEPSTESRRHQRWFKHMGVVGTIRGADTPLRMNKKQAFLFASSPAHFSVVDALRRAERGVLPVETKAVHPAGPSRRRRKQARGRFSNRWHVSYARAPFRGLSHVVEREGAWRDCHWTIRQLRSYRELHEEGQAMRHCVASYDRVCRRGVCTLWSMRCFDAAGEERRLTIDVLPRSRYVLEALGPCNRRATDEERAILSLWAQREGLQLARRL